MKVVVVVTRLVMALYKRLLSNDVEDALEKQFASGMGLVSMIDVLAMLCAWVASDTGEESIFTTLEKNRDRLGYCQEMHLLLSNAMRDLL